jgi:hypothetical protein
MGMRKTASYLFDYLFAVPALFVLGVALAVVIAIAVLPVALAALFIGFSHLLTPAERIPAEQKHWECNCELCDDEDADLIGDLTRGE